MRRLHRGIALFERNIIVRAIGNIPPISELGDPDLKEAVSAPVSSQPKYRLLDLGISREKSPEPGKVYKEKRETFDWSGHQMNNLGQLYKIREHQEDGSTEPREPEATTQLPQGIRKMNLGIDCTKVPRCDYDGFKQKRETFDLSGYESTARGTLQKVTVESVKKRDKSDARQDCAVTTSPAPGP